MNAPSILCVGGSSGGIDALRIVLEHLAPNLPFPIVVVLHRHQDSDDVLMRLLRTKGMPAIIEPFDKHVLSNGAVYLAPPDYHVLLEPGHISLSVDAPVHHSRPSIDVLFASAAEAFGIQTICLVLSGASADGAAGANRIAEKGGTVFVQDPETAMNPTMPEATLQVVRNAQKIELTRIGVALKPFLTTSRTKT